MLYICSYSICVWNSDSIHLNDQALYNKVKNPSFMFLNSLNSNLCLDLSLSSLPLHLTPFRHSSCTLFLLRFVGECMCVRDLLMCAAAHNSHS